MSDGRGIAAGRQHGTRQRDVFGGRPACDCHQIEGSCSFDNTQSDDPALIVRARAAYGIKERAIRFDLHHPGCYLPQYRTTSPPSSLQYVLRLLTSQRRPPRSSLLRH